MNTEEEVIENAANKYAEYCNGGSRGGGIIQQSFTAGALWQQSQSADVAEKKGDKDEEIKRLKLGIEILKDLCQLKKYKDAVGKDVTYKKTQPELWKKADDFLNGLISPSKP